MLRISDCTVSWVWARVSGSDILLVLLLSFFAVSRSRAHAPLLVRRTFLHTAQRPGCICCSRAHPTRVRLIGSQIVHSFALRLHIVPSACVRIHPHLRLAMNPLSCSPACSLASPACPCVRQSSPVSPPRARTQSIG